ncbi:MAG: M48 family metallopeptidase [Candidatus Omnitrophica bacterium]|nr:M48 family metallopeptidase [Candidatus Omnitrophota bacterium]
MGCSEKTTLQERAKKYYSLKYALSLAESGYLIALLILFQASGLSARLVNVISRLGPKAYLVFPLYLAAVYCAYYILNFPLNIYHSFVLERSFCLSNQKFSAWFKDQFKSAAISYIILLVLFAAFYYILAHNPYNWWIIISAVWIFFSLILAKLTPLIIIPLFFKYKVLDDQALRQRIAGLAKKMGVALLDVFEIDLSKKTLKANAALVGWGRSRRVLLADTLKNKYTHEEIEVILAHEFAHYRLKHIFKLIFINSLVTILTFYLIFQSSGYVLELFGLSSLQDTAALPLILLYFVIVGMILRPAENYFSRRMENNADIMALKVTGLKGPFISMMDKLASQNLADRNPSLIIKLFFFDHPPIDERIKTAQSF